MGAAIAVAGLGALVVGITGGRGPNDAENRPYTFWAVAGAFTILGLAYWPQLLSWFVPLDLPPALIGLWKRTGGSIEATRDGRPILALARGLDPAAQRHLATQVVAYGLFEVLLSVPFPITLGVMATLHPDVFTPAEAAPLAAAVVIPALWTAWLALR